MNEIRKEFNLSEKMFEVLRNKKIQNAILTEDIKEFIRLIKEEFNPSRLHSRLDIIRVIDRLAGDLK
jgi:hypothetical protein